MIISRINGGLGNQMFQYAAGRSLAERLNVPLKLDISQLRGDGLRQYALHCFDICQDFASPQEVYAISRIPQTTLQRLVYRLRKLAFIGGRGMGLGLTSPMDDFRVFREESRAYPRRFETIAGDVFLVGYWQSEKFFSNIASIIRREFTLKTPAVGANLEMAQKIEDCNSVSVHVRRGDYVSDPVTNRIHGICSVEYYEAAVRETAEALEQPAFFVFSDDALWTRKNLRIPHDVTFVTHNSPSAPWEDLRLMSLCRHHIIANSSFSWWGAWLGSNEDKMVIAPKKWFREEGLERKDLLPEGWITLDIPLSR